MCFFPPSLLFRRFSVGGKDGSWSLSYPQHFGLLPRNEDEGPRVAIIPGWPSVSFSSATPNLTPPWMTVTCTLAPWDLCASLLKACTSPQWQMTGNRNLGVWPQTRALQAMVASPSGAGPVSANVQIFVLSHPDSSGSGPWNWKLQLHLLLWPMVFAAHFFHMVELLPQGMCLVAEQMGSSFCWVYHVAF